MSGCNILKYKVNGHLITYFIHNSLPLTSILKLHTWLFPASSMATHSTIVSPIANLVPEEDVQVTLESCPELSSTGLSHTDNAVGCPWFVPIVWFAGHVNTVASVSKHSIKESFTLIHMVYNYLHL